MSKSCGRRVHVSFTLDCVAGGGGALPPFVLQNETVGGLAQQDISTIHPAHCVETRPTTGAIQLLLCRHCSEQ